MWAGVSKKGFVMREAVHNPYPRLLDKYGTCLETNLPIDDLKDQLTSSGYQFEDVHRKAPVDFPLMVYISTVAAALTIADILRNWYNEAKAKKADIPRARVRVKGEEKFVEITGSEENFKELVKAFGRAKVGTPAKPKAKPAKKSPKRKRG